MIFNILIKHFDNIMFRYSRMLNVKVTCIGCKETIDKEHFRCLSCVDTNICNKCIRIRENLELDGHNNSHVMTSLR